MDLFCNCLLLVSPSFGAIMKAVFRDCGVSWAFSFIYTCMCNFPSDICAFGFKRIPLFRIHYRISERIAVNAILKRNKIKLKKKIIIIINII